MQINKVTAAGYLFEDPSISFNAEETAATIRFKFGVSESWRDRSSGQNQEHTERFIAVKYNASPAFADFIKNNVRKGTNVYCEGRNRTRKWKPQGSDKDQFITELIINQGIESFQKLGDPKGSSTSSHQANQKPQAASQPAPRQPQQRAASQQPPEYLSERPEPMDFPDDFPRQQGDTDVTQQDYFADLRPQQ